MKFSLLILLFDLQSGIVDHYQPVACCMVASIILVIPSVLVFLESKWLSACHLPEPPHYCLDCLKLPLAFPPAVLFLMELLNKLTHALSLNKTDSAHYLDNV